MKTWIERWLIATDYVINTDIMEGLRMDKKQQIEASVEIMASCVVDAIIKILTRVEEPYIRKALDTLHVRSCSDVEIMRTSAETLEYNPEFFVKTPIDQLVMLVRHEAMHACHLHIRKFGKPAYAVVEDFGAADVKAVFSRLEAAYKYRDRIAARTGEKYLVLERPLDMEVE